MDDKKEKTVSWKNWISMIIILAMIIFVSFFNSQSQILFPDQNEKRADNNTSFAENTTNIDANITMNDDIYFKKLATVSLKTIAENLNCINKGGKNKNFTDIERCGKFLRENTNNSLRTMNQLNVSSSMQVTFEEYKNALINYNIGGEKLEIGAINRNASQMGDAIKHIENGNVGINNMTTFFQNKT